jgi:hypothetical protein
MEHRAGCGRLNAPSIPPVAGNGPSGLRDSYADGGQDFSVTLHGTAHASWPHGAVNIRRPVLVPESPAPVRRVEESLVIDILLL